VRQGLQTPEGAAGLWRQGGGASPTHGESQETCLDSPSGGASLPSEHRTLAPRKRLQRTKTEGALVAFQAHQAWTTTPTAGGKQVPQTPKTPANGSQKQHQDGQKAATAASGADAGAMPMDDLDEVKAAQEKNIAPRLRAQPQEELAKYMAKLDPSRIQEHKKFRQEDPIAGTQQSWGRLWQTLHSSLDPKERFEMEKELLQYYQKASKSVSHDVPLLERSHSRHAIHRSVRAHSRALANPRAPKNSPG